MCCVGGHSFGCSLWVVGGYVLWLFGCWVWWVLVVVLFGVAPGFVGGLEAEAFLFHGGILASRLLKRKTCIKLDP